MVSREALVPGPLQYVPEQLEPLLPARSLRRRLQPSPRRSDLPQRPARPGSPPPLLRLTARRRLARWLPLPDHES